ncbi:Pre-mRNA-splicing factor 18-like protein [Elsinoe fawcettii]|nr:Pre-mRNA-splicing factor 18-like protein [Elsinoe fawcettii]
MDFASLMSAQISKSKSPANADGQKKYLKRADLEAQRLADYEAEQKRAEEERLARLERKRRLDEDEADRAKVREEKRQKLAEESRRLREEEELAEERKRRKRLGLPDLPEKRADADGTPLPTGEEDIQDEDLCSKLRELGEPVTMFGESHTTRLRRYRRLTSKDLAPTMYKGPIPTTLEPVPEEEMKVPESIPKDPVQLQTLYRQLASYFTMVLSEWQAALARRDDEVKQSSSGKVAYNSMLQAREHLVPLYRKLEKGEMEKGILEPVVEIVRCCQNRRYVDANDAYLRLSIGKAAWPIGVTMVGIHERSAREKLHEHDRDAAHIMSDEITRKFLQSIKRCLSFAQTRWPPDDHLQLMG